MSEIKLICDGEKIVPESFTNGGGSLSVKISGDLTDARLSLGGAFANISDGCAKIRLASLADGEYTLFIHRGDISTPIIKLCYCGDLLTPKLTPNDIFALYKKGLEQEKRIGELESRIAILEKSVFSPVIF